MALNPDQLRAATIAARDVAARGGTVQMAVQAAIDCCTSSNDRSDILSATLTARFAFADARAGRPSRYVAPAANLRPLSERIVERESLNGLTYRLTYSWIAPGKGERHGTVYVPAPGGPLTDRQLRQAAFQAAQASIRAPHGSAGYYGPESEHEVTFEITHEF